MTLIKQDINVQKQLATTTYQNLLKINTNIICYFTKIQLKKYVIQDN